MNPEHWDVLTIGGGPGATPGAQWLAGHGQKVAIVERGDGLGGTCLFEGCIPSKIFLESAKRAQDIRNSEVFGLIGPKIQRVDLEQLRKRKASIIAQRVEGANQMCDQLGITVLRGEADFIDPHHLAFTAPGEKPVVLTAKTIIVSPGSISRPLEVSGATGPGIWTSTEALDLSEIPSRLCIIGGGYIGMELATMYRSLGSQVHILEAGSRVLLSEDPLIAEGLVNIWQRTSTQIAIETDVTIDRIEPVAGSESGKVVRYRTPRGGAQSLAADRVLIAIGRAPNTEGLQWSRAGISLGHRGEVPVNEFYQTQVPNIYAPGDVNGQIMLAHAATRQSLIAAQHILEQKTFDRALTVPHVIFSEPEIASVGADSRDLAAHPEWKLTKWSYRQDARALIVGDVLGYAQLIWDSTSHEIQGLQVLGKDAGEMIQEVTYIITHHGTVDALVESIHAHPTMSEVISELAMQAYQEIRPRPSAVGP